MECLDIVRGTLPMPQGTSRPGRGHQRLGSVKPQLVTGIACPATVSEPNPFALQKAKPVELVSFTPSYSLLS